MGQLDNAPSHPNDEGKAAREALRKVTQNLRALQDDLSGQLNQDITRLQGTKHRLLNDIEILEEECQSLKADLNTLQQQHSAELSRQQLAQQQVWAKKLAQALATHLQGRLTQTLYPGSPMGGAVAPDGSLQNAYQLLSSLDSSLNDTLHSLQQDLNSYQSSLSQQISRMHSMEQQGEALLEALVHRLSLQLQSQVARSQSLTAVTNGNGSSNSHYQLHDRQPAPLYPSAERKATTAAVPDGSGTNQPYRPAYAATTESTAPAPVSQVIAPLKTKTSASAFQRGLIFIVLSTLALSFHNVLVGIIGYGGNIFGQFLVEGIFPLSIPNSLLLLWLRMLVVLPLMGVVANSIYPKVWADLRSFLGQPDKRPLFQVIASGGFLFMSQVLIYKAISEIGPGVAVTLLFMYPLITVPLAWFLFGDRPTPLRGLVIFAITIGIVFTALPSINSDLAVGAVSPWGVFAGLLSSAAFALYLVSMQISFRKLHPVPVTLVQFATIFVLTSVILVIGSFFGLQPGQPSSNLGLYIAGILLGGLTLLGYLFNNFGVRLMGAAQASIVAASGPVLTAVLAYFITPGEKSTLQSIQWLGVVLVTLGVLALSLERLSKKSKAPKKVRTS